MNDINIQEDVFFWKDFFVFKVVSSLEDMTDEDSEYVLAKLSQFVFDDNSQFDEVIEPFLIGKKGEISRDEFFEIDAKLLMAFIDYLDNKKIILKTTEFSFFDGYSLFREKICLEKEKKKLEEKLKILRFILFFFGIVSLFFLLYHIYH
ncbi:MAG TPA: hypothetical protein PKC14_01420 [Candidatus Absconditabacterales bacterium]|nr:hypothetical protein [Candidatus Absconditabacterales bacterium]